MRIKRSLLILLPGMLAMMAGSVLLSAVASKAAMPSDGSPAPSVPPLQSVIGGNYEQYDLKADSTGKTVVLYFFPQAFTSD